MIWEFVLGGETIKIRSEGDTMSEGFDSKDWFPLLRVCRQVYSEAALLPQMLTTFFFFDTDVYRSYIEAGLLNRVKHVMIGTWWDKMGFDTMGFPRKYVPDLATAEIILSRGAWGITDKTQIDIDFPGASVTVRQVYNLAEFVEVWKGRWAFEDLPDFSL